MNSTLIVSPAGWRLVQLADDVMQGQRIIFDDKHYIAAQFALDGAIYRTLIRIGEPVSTEQITLAIIESKIRPTLE